MNELMQSELAERRRLADGLVGMLSVRDPETGSHLDAVGRLCARLARRLNLTSAMVEQIELAGRLHDIGKHLVAFDIIAKPSALSADEWAQMKRHSALGAKVLLGFEALEELAPIVRSHHERVDGAGYPDGRAGAEIPLASRIVAICDAFHAMTAARPYAKNREPGDALDELVRCSGTQFDAGLVAVFVDMMQAGMPERQVRLVTQTHDVHGAV